MSLHKLNFKKIIHRLILFIGLGVGAHIIFVLATTERSLLKNLSSISYGHLALLLIFMYLPWIFYALRVFMWSHFLNEHIKYKELLRIVITAELASALSPTAVGGAPVKAALLINRGFSSGSVGFLLTYGVIEDIIFYTTGILLAGIYSTHLLSNVSLNLYYLLKTYEWHMIIFLLIIAFYIYLLRKNQLPRGFSIKNYIPDMLKHKIYQVRKKLSSGMVEMKSNFKMALTHGKLRMLASFLLLWLQWMSKFSVLIVILHAFGVDFDVVQIYIRQWVIYVTMLFIPTPGASGGAEASFLWIFGKSIPSELSFLIVSVWRLFTYYFILLSAVAFYSLLSFVLKDKGEDLEVEVDN